MSQAPQRLADLADIRSGDKGDNVSIGVLARRPEDYSALIATLQPDAIAALFGHWVAAGIPAAAGRADPRR